jgi:hypothetical protein
MTYPAAPCFWVQPSGRRALSLRRYKSSADDGTCPLPQGYHNAAVPVGEGVEERDERGYIATVDVVRYADDPRWPTHCECGYEFGPDDPRQVFGQTLYERPDTGEVKLLHDHGPGAMWDAWWMGDWAKGSDGRSLAVLLPNGREWMIDAEASNCTRKGDRTHKCWVRHGEPPNITVDKNGDTCDAGGGSILAGDYHGFLRDGALTEG